METIQVISEKGIHREIVIKTPRGNKNKDGSPGMDSRTVHQTKVMGNWVATTRKGRGWSKPDVLARSYAMSWGACR